MFIDYFNPYAYLMRARRFAYRRGWLRSQAAEVPVVSVGNLTMGGTGKSPMVLLIAEYLERKGKRVAIVSRGYKRASKGLVIVRNGGDILVPVEESGDEPQMVAALLPNAIVIVDEARVRGAQRARELGAEVIILDDGFQHLQLKRDVNILLANGEVSAVLPFGHAREPESAMQAADLIVFTDGEEKNGKRNEAEIVVTSVPSKLQSFTNAEVPLASLRDKSVLALSSIARPERFQNMLTTLGASVTPFALSDHAPYSKELAKKIMQSAEACSAELIITTMKDAAKSKRF
ncbi:MAG TPA: tetraacyldisaccharide 4'-kinase, partial [Candidatus Kapabacteria bacterium]